jgi:hypothetical protein
MKLNSLIVEFLAHGDRAVVPRHARFGVREQDVTAQPPSVGTSTK